MKKIGHAGTLDPLATGLLIVCTGKMTKQIDQFQAQEKEYTGTFVLGKTTPSHDLETQIVEGGNPFELTAPQLTEASQKFIGIIQQIPPIHSAIKVDGKRAYALARKGKDPDLKPREVTVSAFDLVSINIPEVHFRIICSKGTYIRSLARDFGDELKVGSYLSSLRRTRIGEFKLENALTLEQIASKLSS